MRRVAFRVTGRVQGVGYRRFAETAAIANGLVGHVRNAPDGSVTGEAEGEDAAVQAFAAELQRGPTFSRVDAVELRDLAAVGGHGFEVRR